MEGPEKERREVRVNWTMSLPWGGVKQTNDILGPVKQVCASKWKAAWLARDDLISMWIRRWCKTGIWGVDEAVRHGNDGKEEVSWIRIYLPVVSDHLLCPYS